jgi:release factor glutamine methyltransferase
MDRQALAGHRESDLFFLDVGTGSGALAVTLLAERTQWRAVATDIDESVLQVARSNAQRHQVADRLYLAASDLWTALHRGFPLIVANLPYVSTEKIEGLAPEVARYEPRRALDGGQSGTAVIEKALAMLPQILSPGGTAIFEIGEGQAPLLTTLARTIYPDDELSVTLDGAGAERFLAIDRA